jgi:hypothetical protein
MDASGERRPESGRAPDGLTFNLHIGCGGALNPADRISLTSQMDRLLDQLDESSSRATIFACVHAVEEIGAQFHSATDRGHELALLLCPEFSRRGGVPEWKQDEIREAKDELAQRAGRDVAGVRDSRYGLDRGSHASWSEFFEAGFGYDSSVIPYESQGGLLSMPRYPFRMLADSDSIVEWPLTTSRLFGGLYAIGGDPYLSTLPDWIVRRSLASVRHTGGPVIVAIDLDLSAVQSGQLRYNRDLLGKLLNDYQFDALGGLLAKLNIEELTTLRLKEVSISKLGQPTCVTGRNRG